MNKTFSRKTVGCAAPAVAFDPLVPFNEKKTEPTLHVEALVFDNGGNRILDTLDLRSSAARIGVIGRNGSGKSTLARLLAGLLEPSSGKVTVCGIDPWKDREGALGSIGMLFQNPEHQIMFPVVSEEIAFGLRQQGLTHEEVGQRTGDILEAFGKAHWKDAPVSRLSHGQKHLLCMMSILAMRPELIIADEPFAGLDHPTRRQLSRYLGKTARRIIHVTHDLQDVADYHEVFWIDAGELVGHGRPADVLPRYTERMNAYGETDDIATLAG